MEFNTAAARGVYRIIAKMAPEEAEVFSRMLVSDLYEWDRRANRRLLERADREHNLMVTEEVAKTCLSDLEAGRSDQALATAASVAIAKADGDSWMYQERNHGQWGHMTRHQYRNEMRALKRNRKLSTAQREAEHQRIRHNLRTNLRYGALAGEHGAGARTVGTSADFEHGWNRPVDTSTSGATDAFGRISTGGQLLQGIGAQSGNAKLAMAGAVANYAGQFGPEAEKVIGPSLRRTSYRYRGTERRPDRELGAIAQQRARNIIMAEGRSTADLTVPPLAALTPSQRVHAQEQAAVSYFVGDRKNERKSKIPSADFAELQRKAGKITPSEGIMINRSGGIAHQAVGFAEDHYLPFNLENLGALKGGSYVRSRESGGLTTEDVYTGLLSGARAVTVASNSGVFTMEFDDHLRGGRRYNDKAKQMVTRYGHLLDAIQSEQVRNPSRRIDPRTKAKIRADIESRINDNPQYAHIDQDQKDEWVREEMKRQMSKPHLSLERQRSLMASARAGARDKKEADYIYRQLEDEALQQQATDNYRLDGEGYAAALEALREQFPYYIQRIDYQTKDRATGTEAGRFNSSIDYGYVMPKHLHPKEALHGHYATEVAGEGAVRVTRPGKNEEEVSGKRRGHSTQYQNYRNRTRPRPTETALAEEGGPPSLRPAATSQTPPSLATPLATPPSPTASRAGFSTPVHGPGGEVLTGYRAENERIRAREESERTEREKAEWLGKDLERAARADEDPDSGVSIGLAHGTIHEWINSDAEGRKLMLKDPRLHAKLSSELDEFERDNPLRQGKWPQNRKHFAAQQARSELNADSLLLESSPPNPMRLSPNDRAYYAKGDPAIKVTALTGKSDDELREASNQLRRQRKEFADSGQTPKARDFAVAIHLHEAARVLKAEQEVHAPQAETGTETRTETETKPTETGGGTTTATMTGQQVVDRIKQRWGQETYGNKIEAMQEFGRDLRIHGVPDEHRRKLQRELSEWIDRQD